MTRNQLYWRSYQIIKIIFCGNTCASLLTYAIRSCFGHNGHCNYKLVMNLDDILKYQQLQYDMKIPMISVGDSCISTANATLICCLNS